MRVLKRKPTMVKQRTEQRDPSTEIVARCEAFACASMDDVAQGQEIIDAANALIKQIEAHHEQVIRKAHEAHKEAIATRDRLLAPLKRAVQFVKGICNSFIAEERRKAEEKARIERQRIMEEQRRKAEAEAKAAAKRAGNGNGNGKVVDLVPPPPPPPPAFVPPDVPDFKAAGAKTRRTWNWELTSFLDLVRAVANGEASADLLMVNKTLVNTIVRQQGDKTSIPGIRPFLEEKL